jgi:hypothetical protein
MAPPIVRRPVFGVEEVGLVRGIGFVAELEQSGIQVGEGSQGDPRQ